MPIQPCLKCRLPRSSISPIIATIVTTIITIIGLTLGQPSILINNGLLNHRERIRTTAWLINWLSLDDAVA